MIRPILIADHRQTVRSLVNYTLGSGGYCLLEAEDGVKALETIQAHGPGLIICDVDLPRLGGLELSRTVRGDPLLHRTPIFLLTTDPAAPSTVKVPEGDVNRWFVKPFVPERLLAAVQEIFQGPL